MEPAREPGSDPSGRSPARRRPALKVEVRLFASFLAYLPAPNRAGAAELDVPEDATVDSVVQRLGIPGDATRVVLVNGRDADPEQRLAAGDTVAIFPPLMGGGAR
ncbi:MAG TPA: MoaD/ThiS family protein [Methylomirabilota bacterium]|nr:MoaD/ThiS family protein [Methylomirabilota bacterium]